MAASFAKVSAIILLLINLAQAMSQQTNIYPNDWINMTLTYGSDRSDGSGDNCATADNPTCAANSGLCCPYPAHCYWVDKYFTYGCCPAGINCQGPPPAMPLPSQPAPGENSNGVGEVFDFHAGGVAGIIPQSYILICVIFLAIEVVQMGEVGFY